MRLCDENCNECPLLFENPSNRQLTLILNKLNDRFGNALYRIVEDGCPNLTVCVECRVDDFVHVEGCSIVEVLDVQSSAPSARIDEE